MVCEKAEERSSCSRAEAAATQQITAHSQRRPHHRQDGEDRESSGTDVPPTQEEDELRGIMGVDLRDE